MSPHAFAEHADELEVELSAATMPALFTDAARALAEAIAGDVPQASGATHRVALETHDREALLVAWLNELVFLSDRDKRVYPDVRILELNDHALVANVRGADVGTLRRQVKAATFHGLRIRDREDGGVAATVLFDV